MLRETLGTQRKALQVVVEKATKHYKGIKNTNPATQEPVALSEGINPSPRIISSHEFFMERCEEMSNSLEHFAVLAKGNEEQLKNLLSLMVSLEQIAQGQSVGRLNVLAFTFLPLSFMAVGLAISVNPTSSPLTCSVIYRVYLE
jgi:hypothetical protein